LKATIRHPAPSAPPARDVSLDYLRATLTLMVVAHHCCLAYTTFAHADPGNYLASTAPIVDRSRWLFLDYAENFNDVFFMSLMFFISGLFVWPSLKRHGPAAFLGHRIIRLGLPFAVLVPTLMPLAYYASWRAGGHPAGYLAFWRHHVTSDGWPPGPLWFVWLLLLFNLGAASRFAVLPRTGPQSSKAMTIARTRPWLVAALLSIACAAVYLPMLVHFGFGAWTAFITQPFYFQICRIGLYAVWFLAGVWVGAGDLDQGLLSRHGALARHWPWWVAGGVVAYNLLVFLPRLGGFSTLDKGALWVISCVASSFGFLALFRGLVRRPRPWMRSIARSSYGIYLVHYLFVLWLQYLFLPLPLHAGVKFLATFALAVLCSWAATQVLLRIPGLKRVL